MANSKSLQKRNCYRSDPVAARLIEKFHLSPLSLGLLSSAIVSGLALLTAWVSNTLWDQPEQKGLL